MTNALNSIRSNRVLQLFIGLLIGVAFGFLLEKGGVTRYEVIIGQLLLTDFTVVKVMLSAVLSGMILTHILKSLGLVTLHPKPGSIGSSVVGGLIFGVGFAILGYCPGTVAGAVAEGSLDALFGGVVGIIIGSGIFAILFPALKNLLSTAPFKALTVPELLKVSSWVVVLPVALGIILLLFLLEKVGL
jgi:hypothetical protein